MRHLGQVVCKKIIPDEVPVWYDEEVGKFFTNTGSEFSPTQLDQYAWHIKTMNQSIRNNRLLSEQIKELEAEIENLKRPKLPDNVIPFPGTNNNPHGGNLA